MVFPKIFRRKKPEEKKIEPKEEAPELEGRSKEKIKESIPPKVKKELKKKSEEAYRILKIPQVTEKAGDLANKNQYVFKIYPKANKKEVKKAIEEIFGVTVVGVKIINLPGKKRRLGRIEGFKPGYKKAIVKIKEGQKIEVLPR